MNTVDFEAVLAQRLKDAGYEGVTTRKLETAKDYGVVVRRGLPTTTAQYFDGTRSVQLVTSVFVVRKDEARAIDECQAIADEVPRMALDSANGSYDLTSVEVYAEPQEQAMAGFPTIWRVQFQADIRTKG